MNDQRDVLLRAIDFASFRLPGQPIGGHMGTLYLVNDLAAEVRKLRGTKADLLALAHQYASECGDCAGARVCPDDEPCTACADVWAVIDKAEGRT